MDSTAPSDSYKPMPKFCLTFNDFRITLLTQVMPWIDFAWEINQNLNDDQIANPRLFKSHARLSAVQEGCKVRRGIS